MTTQQEPSKLVTKSPKTRKFVDERGIANQGSYSETLHESVAWDIGEAKPVTIPTGSAISVTSGGWQGGLNATCVRGHVRVGNKETAIAYIA